MGMDYFWILLFLPAFGLLFHCFQILAVRLALRAENLSPPEPPMTLPPVSILKPLKGLDDNLFDNLESFCLQDYPEYEIIFSLQDGNDPAHKVATKIKEKHSSVRIAVVVQPCHEGLNPKVNNMLPAYRRAAYPLILISDSNVMVKKDYLKRIVASMNSPEVGLVCNLIRGVGGKTVGSLFENLHMNSFILGNICFLNRFFRMPCVVGKSMLLRKKDLESIGGLQGFKDVLAEDYLIGTRIRQSGRKVVISSDPINNVNEYWNLRKFVNRHSRWGKMRWKIGGIKYFSELLINPVFMSLIPLLYEGLSAKAVVSMALVGLTKGTGDYYLGKSLRSSMSPLAYLLAPLKDLLIGILWFVPMVSDTVVWRESRYAIGKDTVLSPLPEMRWRVWGQRMVEGIKERMAWSPGNG
jgi:ceramide glucosyltransferase